MCDWDSSGPLSWLVYPQRRSHQPLRLWLEQSHEVIAPRSTGWAMCRPDSDGRLASRRTEDASATFMTYTYDHLEQHAEQLEWL